MLTKQTKKKKEKIEVSSEEVKSFYQNNPYHFTDKKIDDLVLKNIRKEKGTVKVATSVPQIADCIGNPSQEVGKEVDSKANTSEVAR